MQAESNEDDLSLPGNLLRTIPAETLQTIWKYDTWMKSIVRDTSRVQNPIQGDKNIELAPLPSRSALFSSERSPSNVIQVSAENTGADLSGDSYEPRGPVETGSQEHARVLRDQMPRISPTEVMSSLPKFRMEYQWIKPLSNESWLEGSTSMIEAAQILNTPIREFAARSLFST
ncbi:hypothetical protein M407DRAFT_27675 [Tulasnella calospora MUT 4182]|uniref:Uncharacterized protein n=1 Tax=Tulasnella calospora MUT 4182 TaxID=1051891 RepID=A0A0C3QDF8_9AGAM|nr:hypothetical protein M407DRAFT_27675 [Tulasnella calospora MUT 4182]